MVEKLLRNLTASFYLAVFVAANAAWFAYLGGSTWQGAFAFAVFIAAGFLAIDYSIARRLVQLATINADIASQSTQDYH